MKAGFSLGELLLGILNKIQDRLSGIEHKVDELKAEMQAMRGHLIAMLGFVLGAAVVFVAMARQAVNMIWQPDPPDSAAAGPVLWVDWITVVVPVALLVVLGLWMPEALHDLLSRAATLVQGRP